MKITEIQNGVTKLNHNGTGYITDLVVGEVGDQLTRSLRDVSKWVNEKTGDYVSDSFLFSEIEARYNELENEMYAEAN